MPLEVLVWDGAVEVEETVSQILEVQVSRKPFPQVERRQVGTVGEHPSHEIVDGDDGAEVDDIYNEVGQVTLEAMHSESAEGYGHLCQTTDRIPYAFENGTIGGPA